MKNRIIVGENEGLIRNHTIHISESRKEVQRAVEIYNSIGFDEDLKDEELKTLLINSKAFITDKLEAIELPTLNGKQLVRGAYLSLIGINKTEEKANEITQIKRKIAKNLHNENTFILKGGEVIHNTKETKRFIEGATVFATTPKEIEAYHCLLELKEVMNKLNEYHIKFGMGNIRPNNFHLDTFLHQLTPAETYNISLNNYRNLTNTVW